MSVFTFLLFLTTVFPAIAVCAPNQRANKLLSSIQAKIQSDQSIQSVFTATANPAAASSYLSSIEAIPSFPPDSSSSTLGAKHGLERPSTAASARSPGPFFSPTQILPSGNGNTGEGAAGTVVQSYTLQGAQPIPSGTSNIRETFTGGGLQPCSSSGAPYSIFTYTPQEGGLGKNGTGGSVTPRQLPAQTVTVITSETITVTVPYPITAGLVLPYSSNVGIGTGFNAAPSYPPPVGASSDSAAGSSSGKDAATVPSNIPSVASTAGLVASMAPASNNGAVDSQANQPPIQTARTGRGSSLAALNLNTVPIYSPHPAGTPIPLQNSLYQIVGSFGGTATAQISLPPPVASTTTQTPPPSSSGVNSPCVNNTSTRNMTANYADVNPNSDFGPLIYFGLNYTTFFSTSYPAPNHLATAPESRPKTIAIASHHLSFTLYTLALFCASSSPIMGNCTIEMFGLGKSGPGNSQTGSIRAITMFGAAERDLTFGEEWKDLSEVTFRAMYGNVTVGVGLRAAEYAVTDSC